MQKPLGIGKINGWRDRPIDLSTDSARCTVVLPRLKRISNAVSDEVPALVSARWQLAFLGATTHLYNGLCPSVGWSVGRLVGNALVRRSTRRTLL